MYTCFKRVGKGDAIQSLLEHVFKFYYLGLHSMSVIFFFFFKGTGSHSVTQGLGAVAQS